MQPVQLAQLILVLSACCWFCNTFSVPSDGPSEVRGSLLGDNVEDLRKDESEDQNDALGPSFLELAAKLGGNLEGMSSNDKPDESGIQVIDSNLPSGPHFVSMLQRRLRPASWFKNPSAVQPGQPPKLQATEPNSLISSRLDRARNQLSRIRSKEQELVRLQDGLTAANSAENDVLNDLEVVEQDDAPGKSVDLSGPVMPPELEGEQGAVTPDAPKKAKAQWRRIKMSICGGAPDSMVPFDRRQSPWGSEMNVQGLYNGGKQARRSMLEQVQLPGEKFSAGRLEDADESGDLGSSKLQEAGGAVNATHDGEFSGSDARREAMLVDAREGDLRSPEYDLDRARVGPATLRALSSTAGQDDGAVFPDAAVGDDDQENYLNPECPNAAVSNSTGLAAMQTSRRSLLRGRVRASGGAFGSGTEEKPTGCSKKLEPIPLENRGFGAHTQKNIRPGEAAIVGCLRDPKKCTSRSFSMGPKLPSMKIMNRIPKYSLGQKRFRSCALVGNAGHMINKKYGSYIDRHEAVVRFNVADISKFGQFVGTRTTFRVLNNAESQAACCRGRLPEKSRTRIGLILWYPGAQREMKKTCASKWPIHKVHQLSTRFVSNEVRAMKAMRMDMQRLGFGRQLDEWKQLSTGGHAVLLFSQVCDSISLYGFTTWPDKAKSDHYYTRDRKTRSGLEWHDWGGESLAWRMLFSAGKLAICSN